MINLKNNRMLVAIATAAAVCTLIAFSYPPTADINYSRKTSGIPKGCVFRTIMGEENSDSAFVFKTDARVNSSLTRGLSWLAEAQHNDGGWGAGNHRRQDIRNPHAVPSDPATTAMVSMALLRSGTTLTGGEFSNQLRKALEYLLRSTEQSSPQSTTITDQTGTQIQTKLGANIDVVLTAQFFANVMDYVSHDAQLKTRIQNALNQCVTKIQRAQEKDGSIQGAGWAGVLQSSFANNALEAAQYKGAEVDAVALQRSRDYQQGNYNAKTGDAKTDKGAGIVLYSVSSSTRASAKEARQTEEVIAKAKREGKLHAQAPVSKETLESLGYSREEATRYANAYDVYQSAKKRSQDDVVMEGFGNNGGEEFLSYLQTGESLIIGKDNDWKRWYDNMSGRLLRIQNNDGSWHGHHCITSPVFCTATCILILSVNNDITKLTELGTMKR